MNEYYTRQQAMERLGIRSANAFLQLVRKYPEAFVNINPHIQKDKHPWYDKPTVDKFHQMREYFKREKP